MDCDETRLMALGGHPRLRGTLVDAKRPVGYELTGKKANSELNNELNKAPTFHLCKLFFYIGE